MGPGGGGMWGGGWAGQVRVNVSLCDKPTFVTGLPSLCIYAARARPLQHREEKSRHLDMKKHPRQTSLLYYYLFIDINFSWVSLLGLP